MNATDDPNDDNNVTTDDKDDDIISPEDLVELAVAHHYQQHQKRGEADEDGVLRGSSKRKETQCNPRLGAFAVGGRKPGSESTLRASERNHDSLVYSALEAVLVQEAADDTDASDDSNTTTPTQSKPAPSMAQAVPVAPWYRSWAGCGVAALFLLIVLMSAVAAVILTRAKPTNTSTSEALAKREHFHHAAVWSTTACGGGQDLALHVVCAQNNATLERTDPTTLLLVSDEHSTTTTAQWEWILSPAPSSGYVTYACFVPRMTDAMLPLTTVTLRCGDATPTNSTTEHNTTAATAAVLGLYRICDDGPLTGLSTRSTVYTLCNDTTPVVADTGFCHQTNDDVRLTASNRDQSCKPSRGDVSFEGVTALNTSIAFLQATVERAAAVVAPLP